MLIIGGGLAGMTAGRALAKAGFPVTLLEGSARLGGKAGADISGGRAFEHGYHIFPAWYRNVRGLLAELGISLIDFDRWHYLKPEGESPRYVTQSVPDSLTSLLKMLRTGLLPWPDALLYWYFVLDMLGQPLSNKAVLDQVSRVGMMRDRWYMTKHIPEMEQENVLKASAIPAYEMSAMTAKLISSFWVRAPMPFLSILKGDLQSHFIEPYAATVRAAGVNVRLNEKVTKLVTTGGRISEVQSTGGSYHPELVLVTTPLEVTRK
ncbi:MAG: FAD-dependent oxidoreductase, partial [Myxococcaceae bacterium]